MKTLLSIGFLGGLAWLGWQAGGSLDTDAIGMAVGIFLGVVAAIPAALLVLAAGRRRENSEGMRRQKARRAHPHQLPGGYGGYGAGPWGAPQPPVIVLAGAGMQGNAPGQFGAGGVQEWNAPRPERRFKLVGEQEAWIDEW